MNRSIGVIVMGLGILTLPGAGADEGDAGGGVIASQSVHVQPSGPRTRPGQSRFLDVEGTGIDSPEKYAAFALVDFPAPKPPAAVEKPTGLTLALTQRVERYSRDGKVKFYLVADVKEDLQAFTKTFKFDLASPDGLAGSIKEKVEVGSGTFTRKATGQVDRFVLVLDEKAREVLDVQIKAGTIRVLVVPDEPTVAATFLGAGPNNEAGQRPRLIVGSAPAK